MTVRVLTMLAIAATAPTTGASAARIVPVQAERSNCPKPPPMAVGLKRCPTLPPMLVATPR